MGIGEGRRCGGKTHKLFTVVKKENDHSHWHTKCSQKSQSVCNHNMTPLNVKREKQRKKRSPSKRERGGDLHTEGTGKIIQENWGGKPLGENVRRLVVVRSRGVKRLRW